MTWLTVEAKASVSLGRTAGFRGRLQASADGLVVQIVDLRWVPLRTSTDETNPREHLLDWGQIESLEIVGRGAKRELRLRAVNGTALAHFPGAKAWTWIVSIGGGQDLVAHELEADVALRLAEHS